MRPGLSGWAQVNGNTHLTNSQKLALDIWYVDHRSASLDARVLRLTPCPRFWVASGCAPSRWRWPRRISPPGRPVSRERPPNGERRP